MTWDITNNDYDDLHIKVTNGVQEFYLPKFRIGMSVDEPTLSITWTDTEFGEEGKTRLLDIDFNDVSNPVSDAADLKALILSMELSEFGGGGGTGDFVGPASSVDNHIVTFDGTTGKLGKDSGYSIADILALTGSSPFITPQMYGALGTVDTFDDLGINQLTVDATYPGTGAVTTDTVDWAACQYAINQSISLNMPLLTYGRYYVNRGLVVTPTEYEFMWEWDGRGAKFYTTTSDTFTVIKIGAPTTHESDPLTPQDAMWLVNNTYYIHNLFVYMVPDVGQVAYDFGPSYSSRFIQLHAKYQ